jgi:transaldolase
MADPLAALTDAGVSIWLDDLSRTRLVDGSLARLVRDRDVRGVTTNPTIFAKAIAGGSAYGGHIQQLALRRTGVDAGLRELTTFDVRWAADILRPVYEATGGVDGRVSIEVDPRISRDTDRTIAEARALWWLVDRPNLFIKIPAVEQSLPAISACLADGISVNVTLIYSLGRYAEVIDAFLTGLERARDRGIDLSTIASVASFFVSRVDTAVDRRLDASGSDRAAGLRGRAATANARLAYRLHERALGSDRWKALEAAGARPQRPLWASTGVKDPAYPDTRYVVDLVAPGVVNTMPEATLDAVADHATVEPDTIHGTYEEAEAVLRDLASVGIGYAEVVQQLEEDGVATFSASWTTVEELLARELAAPRTEPGAGGQPTTAAGSS